MSRDQLEINEYIRERIVKSVREEGVYNFATRIKNSEENLDILGKVFSSSIYNILFLDSYKILSDKVRSGFATPDEIEQYSLISSISKIDDLNNSIFRSINYLSFGIMNAYEFKEMPALGKIQLVKSLGKVDNMYLSKVSSLHTDDIKKYDFTLDMDYIYSQYKKYCNYLNQNFIAYSPDSINKMLSGIICKISLSRYEEMFKLVTEMNKDIFSNIDKYSPELEEIDDSREIENLITLYHHDPFVYNTTCILNNDSLLGMVDLYIPMREKKYILSKKVNNE